MELSDFLSPERVVLLAGSTKAETMAEMIDLLLPACEGISREELTKAVWKRERLMSWVLSVSAAEWITFARSEWKISISKS